MNGTAPSFLLRRFFSTSSFFSQPPSRFRTVTLDNDGASELLHACANSSSLNITVPSH